ncbi:hypothetical protein [Streptomyces sp. NPDC059909]|uniref:hypothetical protein n=1 Tax=Streptomyces sp. NPDC059909 TaxID=3346998 RepID=UPI00365E7358
MARQRKGHAVVDIVAESIIVNATEGHLKRNLAEMNSVVQELGWTPSGSVAPPGCRRWEAGGVFLHLASWGSGWALDFVFAEVWPEDVDELGSEAIDSAIDEQLPFCREVQESLLQALRSRTSVSVDDGAEFADSEFVESSAWNVAGSPLAVGIASNDVDTPVLVMARLLLGS